MAAQPPRAAVGALPRVPGPPGSSAGAARSAGEDRRLRRDPADAAGGARGDRAARRSRRGGSPGLSASDARPQSHRPRCATSAPKPATSAANGPSMPAFRSHRPSWRCGWRPSNRHPASGCPRRRRSARPGRRPGPAADDQRKGGGDEAPAGVLGGRDCRGDGAQRDGGGRVAAASGEAISRLDARMRVTHMDREQLLTRSSRLT